MEYMYYGCGLPTVETYKCVQLTYHQKSFSEGLIKLMADIKPSPSELIKFLRSRELIGNYDIVSSQGYYCTEYISRTYKGKNFLNAVADFCDNNLNFQLSARAYSFGDACAGGDSSSTEKAIKKIKKQLREKYPSLQVLKNFVYYLEDKNLIAKIR